jgi:hypothetical protein
MPTAPGSRGPAVVKSTVRRSRRFEISAVGHPPSRLLFYALLLLLFGYGVHRNPVAGVFGVLGFVIFIALYLIVRGPIAFRVGNADPPGLVLVNGREVRSREGHSIRRLERSVQYQQGDHILTLATGDPVSSDGEERAAITETENTITAAPSQRMHTARVLVKLKLDTHWDPPYDREAIGIDELAEIGTRITEALVFLETNQ